MIRILLLSTALLAPALPAQSAPPSGEQVAACRQRYLNALKAGEAGFASNAPAELRLAYWDLKTSAHYAFVLINAQSYTQLCQARQLTRLDAAIATMFSETASRERAAPGVAASSMATALDHLDQATRPPGTGKRE